MLPVTWPAGGAFECRKNGQILDSGVIDQIVWHRAGLNPFFSLQAHHWCATHPFVCRCTCMRRV